MRRFIDEFQTAGNESTARDLLAVDFLDRTPFPGFGPHRESVLDLFRMLRTAFPDLTVEVVEQFADGDRVATRKTLHGTHRGTFAGMPPTGRRVAIRVMDIVRVENGAIREHTNVVDVAGLMTQLCG